MSKLKTRKPTGLAPWPFILVEGPEKTGKSYAAALLTKDARIGDAYWLDCGEGAADQYAAVPGVQYDVLDHDGSYKEILEQVLALTSEVPGVDPKTGLPNLFVLDSSTNLWALIKAQADADARKRKNAGPDVEIQITMDLWNRARDRWKAIIDPLIRWDGIVILTARGKEVAKMENGKPVAGQKDYTIESHKTLPFDVDVIVRPVAPGQALLMGARSIHVNPGQIGKTLPKYGDTGLAGLLFDTLKLGGEMGARDYKPEIIEASNGLVNVDAVKAEAVAVLAELLGHVPADSDKAPLGGLWKKHSLPGSGAVPFEKAEAFLSDVRVLPVAKSEAPKTDEAAA